MGKRLKVAMIAPPWLPIPPEGYGGIENVIHALVPELIKLGVHVELFTIGETKLRASKKHWLYKEGHYKNIHQPHYDTAPMLTAHLLHALNAIAEDGSFDIIHDHNNFVGPLALAHANHKLPPAIHTLHNPRFVGSEKNYSEANNMQMWRQLTKTNKLYFVGLSKSVKRTAPRSLKPKLLDSVHNAVIVKEFPFEPNKHDYFITLGRFHPEKGQARAVQAVIKLGQKLKMAGVVGDLRTPKQVLLELANPQSSYRSLADFRYFSDHIFPFLDEELIQYVGEVSGSRKLRLLSKARALLSPIDWEEPFGMAVIEAMACGTPVIGMARGALPEIIQHGKTGFLVSNQRELEKYMKHVGDIDPADCRKAVEEKFSAPVMAKAYLDRYREVIAKHRAMST